MTVTATLGSQIIGDVNNGNTYTSSSFTPSAGKLLLMFVHPTGTRVSGAGALTSSVSGQSFSLVEEINWATASRGYVYISDAVTTAVPQTVTFDCTADQGTSCSVVYYEISGSRYTGLNAIRQSSSAAGASGATRTVTLDTACDITHLTVIGHYMAVNAGIVEPIGWTEDLDGPSSTEIRQELAHRDSGFNGTDITWDSTPGAVWAAFAVEFDASGDPGPTTWNPSDAATGYTFSNGNLTAIGPDTGSWPTVRSTTSRTTGTLYAEFQFENAPGTQDCVFGIAASGLALADYLGTAA